MPQLHAGELINPSQDQLTAVAELFDQYRQHYGQPVTPGQTLVWLTSHTSQQQLTVFTAHLGPGLAGIATIVSVPASLTLGSFWQIRDLYVIPTARRHGVARALLNTIRQAATTAGAIRLSLQTEPGNTAALRLYQTCGFTPVKDIQALILPL